MHAKRSTVILQRQPLTFTRADADFMLWRIASGLEALQGLAELG